MGFPCGSVVKKKKKKNLPAMQENWVYPCVRKIPWRRAWQPTPVPLPGESHGQRSLAGCSPQVHTEAEATAATKQQQQMHNIEIKTQHREKRLKIKIWQKTYTAK